MAVLDSVKLYRDKGKEAWGKLTSKQKLVFSLLGVGVVALFVAIIVMVGSGSGGMVPLKVPVDPSSAVRVLASYGIKAEHDLAKASVVVPKEQEQWAALILASAQILPRSGLQQYGFLSESGLTQTDERTRMQYLIQTQDLLSKILEAQPYISQATVVLTPAQKPWDFRLPDADILGKASVSLTLRDIQRLSEEQHISVATLVAGALPTLKPENVTVTDQFGSPYIVDSHWKAALSVGRMRYQLEQAASHKVERLLGDQNAIVEATIRIDNPTELIKDSLKFTPGDEGHKKHETTEDSTDKGRTLVGSAGADGGEIGRDRRDDPGRATTFQDSTRSRGSVDREFEHEASKATYNDPIPLYDQSSLSVTIVSEDELTKERMDSLKETASKATTIPIANIAIRSRPPTKATAMGPNGVGEGLVAFLKSDNAMKLVLLVIALGSVVALMIMLKKSAPKPLTLVDEGMEEAEEPMVEVPGLPPVDQLHGNLVREKVVELVRKNPKAAANLVKRWMIFGK